MLGVVLEFVSLPCQQSRGEIAPVTYVVDLLFGDGQGFQLLAVVDDMVHGFQPRGLAQGHGEERKLPLQVPLRVADDDVVSGGELVLLVVPEDCGGLQRPLHAELQGRQVLDALVADQR
ncbi:hypothetical protein C2845_PM13G11690 [Panicum miliaceum]|uniref:Uncharacterized protein n=1 Tax=Panicum miliaceum TaxID=4540 RepID=A0A3L6RK96_PANMI|nr:hypothetical protein C2845_PM13G11690 [Panicum miliaceum]